MASYKSGNGGYRTAQHICTVIEIEFVYVYDPHRQLIRYHLARTPRDRAVEGGDPVGEAHVGSAWPDGCASACLTHHFARMQTHAKVCCACAYYGGALFIVCVIMSAASTILTILYLPISTTV